MSRWLGDGAEHLLASRSYYARMVGKAMEKAYARLLTRLRHQQRLIGQLQQRQEVTRRLLIAGECENNALRRTNELLRQSLAQALSLPQWPPPRMPLPEAIAPMEPCPEAALPERWGQPGVATAPSQAPSPASEEGLARSSSVGSSTSEVGFPELWGQPGVAAAPSQVPSPASEEELARSSSVGSGTSEAAFPELWGQTGVAAAPSRVASSASEDEPASGSSTDSGFPGEARSEYWV